VTPEEFAHEFGHEFTAQQTSTIDHTPYGHNPQAKPVKTGLTPRGKVALAISAAAIATGGIVGYQMYSADQAQSEAKAQEIAYKKDLLELEKLKVQSQVNKTQDSATSTRQKQVDACVANSKDLVGKSLNSSYRDIVEACQAQYTGSGSEADMQTAASSHATSGSVNQGVFIVGGVFVVGLVVLVRKGTKSHAA
jgi:cobalamin biosynthesis Mg chelatase CobN